MFVIIGSITADIVVFGPASAIRRGADGFRTSNLVFTDRPPAILMGGNGGNSACALASLGATPTLCGAVGQDLLGHTLLDWLVSRGVDVDPVLRSAVHATSSSTIISSDPTTQTVLHHLGATEAVRSEHLRSPLLQRADVLLCSSFRLMTHLRPHGFARALEITHEAGGLTALDIGPAIGRVIGLNELSPLLPNIDYLIGNVHEITTLAAEGSHQAAARRLLQAGARSVLVKQGRDGCGLYGQEGYLEAPAFSVEARISVGAGDSFNVGFLYALEQGRSTRRALEFGSAVAALVISSERGVLGAPSLEEVEALLAEQRPRQAPSSSRRTAPGTT